MTLLPLQDKKLVTLALNVPGPVAAARLAKLGAKVTKVEPPSGDALKMAARPWYDSLTERQTVIRLDLKSQEGSAQLGKLLEQSDLLLTSFRPSALQRLQLDWETLHPRYPRLCVVNIIGYPSPQEEIPGHDLTYQAKLGLLRPSQMPITLHADMAGAERSVSAALALLLNFARTGQAECAHVSLYEAMQDFAGPLAAGLTLSTGHLGGGFPFYSMYEASDGWIAVGALEPAFVKRLVTELGLISVFGEKDARVELQKIFRTRSAAEWEQWAQQHDLPIVSVAS